jgi:hypothetical protein
MNAFRSHQPPRSTAIYRGGSSYYAREVKTIRMHQLHTYAHARTHVHKRMFLTPRYIAEVRGSKQGRTENTTTPTQHNPLPHNTLSRRYFRA